MGMIREGTFGLKGLGVAMVVLLFLCVLDTPTPAHAAEKDSDGYVPLRFSCKPNANYFGFYEWSRVEGHEVRGRIVINYCKLQAIGAGPYDYRMVYQHELAHAHGLEHYQKTPKQNAAYYPYFRLCRC